jgi:hypothetical protein
MSNPNPSPATRFKKGQRHAGRAVGTPNKITLSARQIIDDAFHGIGGTERLIKWINKSPKNESAWWNNIWVRTLPQSATVRAEIEHNVALSGEELRKALIAHNLPLEVFGIDAPPLIEAAPTIDAVPVEDDIAAATIGCSTNGGRADGTG